MSLREYLQRKIIRHYRVGREVETSIFAVPLLFLWVLITDLKDYVLNTQVVLIALVTLIAMICCLYTKLFSKGMMSSIVFCSYLITDYIFRPVLIEHQLFCQRTFYMVLFMCVFPGMRYYILHFIESEKRQNRVHRFHFKVIKYYFWYFFYQFVFCKESYYLWYREWEDHAIIDYFSTVCWVLGLVLIIHFLCQFAPKTCFPVEKNVRKRFENPESKARYRDWEMNTDMYAYGLVVVLLFRVGDPAFNCNWDLIYLMVGIFAIISIIYRYIYRTKIKFQTYRILHEYYYFSIIAHGFILRGINTTESLLCLKYLISLFLLTQLLLLIWYFLGFLEKSRYNHLRFRVKTDAHIFRNNPKPKPIFFRNNLIKSILLSYISVFLFFLSGKESIAYQTIFNLFISEYYLLTPFLIILYIYSYRLFRSFLINCVFLEKALTRKKLYYLLFILYLLFKFLTVLNYNFNINIFWYDAPIDYILSYTEKVEAVENFINSKNFTFYCIVFIVFLLCIT